MRFSQLTFVLVLASGLFVALHSSKADQVPTLSFVGEYILPTGLSLNGVEFGGISALDFDPRTNTYFALSDDQAERGPARFYQISIDLALPELNSSSAGGIRGINIDRMVEIRAAGGEAFARGSVDPEALRLAGGILYWGHERDAKGIPFAGAMRVDGVQVSEFELPNFYKPEEGRGIRKNLAIESLAVSRDGKQATFGLENALQQDGPAASLTVGSPSRLIVFNVAGGEAVAEYVYMTEPVAEAPQPDDGFRTNGLSELLHYDETRLLALERSFSVGRGVVIRIFMIDISDASNVLGQASLKNEPFVPVRKTLVATFRNGDPVSRIDNLEAMTFGPVINGKRTLIFVSDNNFNPDDQLTQFMAFTMD